MCVGRGGTCKLRLSRILGTIMALMAVSISALASGEPRGALLPTHLRCEYAADPMGVDTPHPRLFWQVESTARNQMQSAYQVIVGSSKDLLDHGRGDLWDSGRTASEETLQIPYAGKTLHSTQRVFWKVRCWDRVGHTSAWSAPASWTMGLLDTGDWQGRWIGGSAPEQETVLLRREFVVRPGLRRAVAFVCGLGQYEMSLNGRKVGEDLLTPGWTNYAKTCLYDTYDITAQLHTGANATGLFLGNGMYRVHGGRYTKFTGSFGPLKAICMLRLEYTDGTSVQIGSDGQWKTHAGPITFSSIYGGEDCDARLVQSGWDRTGFAGPDWADALLTEGPGGRLRGLSAAAPPLRALETLLPVLVRVIRPGVTVYDLGRNASVMPRLRVQGDAGAVVRITGAELLHSDGTVDRGSSGGGQAYWQWTLAGNAPESCFPRFFYQGCRYLQVECLPAVKDGPVPTVSALEGIGVHSVSPPIGEFACSNDLFNRIHTLIRRAQENNMVSVLTDCPHRERLGWLEQDHLNGPSLRYEFDLAQLFGKIVNDMADSQLPNGLVPDIAPEYTVFSGGFRDSPEWGSALPLCAWQQYEWTGDKMLLQTYYPQMQAYVAYLGSKAKDDIVSHGLGDWYDLGPGPPGYAQLTPIALTATAFYYADTVTLARTAAVLGRTEDARRFDALANRIREAFNRRLFHADTGQYATGSQTANSIALVMDLVPVEQRARVLDNLVKDVRAHGNGLTAGDVGCRYLLRALADGNRSDVIFDVNAQSDKPGYGYQLAHGATSLTEAWNAGPNSSQDHFMLGQLMEWFYHDLAGIGIDPAGPGFKKIFIRPQPVGDVTSARASCSTLRGKVSVDWKRNGGVFSIYINLPANTTATVWIPSSTHGSVRVNGVSVEHAEGVRFLRQEGGEKVYSIGSGRCDFQTLP